MGKFWFILVKGLVVVVLLWSLILLGATGAGVNWGTQASHPLPAATVVRMLKDNGFQKVKLFDADSRTLKALSNSGIEVMVGIPNDMLSTFAISPQAAQNWVARNISSHSGVNIRYVAVGNEPFLSTYNGSFMNTTFPALQNIHSALKQAGLSSQVKVTIPLNADVYESSTSYPSGGDFRPDMHDLMLAIVQFLSDNGSPITVNIYPFISLYKDPSFPLDYAFFDGYSSPINDGGIIYENVFDANYDTLVAALTKNGYGNMSIIVGEIGWPTDGDQNANPTYARRFNQGFFSRVSARKGTPLRPGPTDAYLFSLIDEDAKSTQPGNFERHWGIFYFDGTLKYQLNMGTATSNGGNLVAARDVHYLGKQWCVMSGTASLDDPQVGPSVTYACSMADCTSLGYGSSCGNLDARGNISYAFNDYYQMNNQLQSACGFLDNLSVITTQDPSMGNCSFRIMIQPDTAAGGVEGGARPLQKCVSLVIFVATFLFINF